jgi:glycosyltransferase involved in cell wall biosynthesis
MNVLVTLAHRFQRTPDGAVWTLGPFAYSFWERYRTVFDGVRVLARVREVATVAEDWRRADGPGVTFAAVPHYRGPWQYLRQARRVRSAVRAAFVPGEAVICRAPGQIADSLVPMLRRLDYPYAVEVVGDPYDVFAPGSIRHPLRPFFRWYFPHQLRRQCATACGTAYVTQHALPQRYPCPAHQTYFSDVELPPSAWAAQPRPVRPPGRAFTLISVGSLEQPYKGIDVLIDAVAVCVRDNRDLRLVIVGDGQLRSALEAQTAKYSLQKRVDFRGQLPAGAEVRSALDGADLFVMPSRTEGLPRAMIEAMARALPCLGSRVGGIPELLAEEDLVSTGDVAGLAARITEVLSDPQRLARMSARNLHRAAAYRPEILRERLVTYYRYVREQTCRWSETNPSRDRKGADTLNRSLTVAAQIGARNVKG